MTTSKPKNESKPKTEHDDDNKGLTIFNIKRKIERNDDIIKYRRGPLVITNDNIKMTDDGTFTFDIKLIEYNTISTMSGRTYLKPTGSFDDINPLVELVDATYCYIQTFSMAPDPSIAGLYIEHIRNEDDGLYATLRILDTQTGTDFKSLLASNIYFYPNPHIVGVLNDNNEVESTWIMEKLTLRTLPDVEELNNQSIIRTELEEMGLPLDKVTLLYDAKSQKTVLKSIEFNCDIAENDTNFKHVIEIINLVKKLKGAN